MALMITKLSEEEVAEQFSNKRAGASEDNIAPYVAMLKDNNIQVGDGFKLAVGHGEDDDTVRATKRRFNAASKSLGYNLKWKVQGHTEKAEVTENGHTSIQDVFVEDWLIVRAVSSEPVSITTNADGSETRRRGRPKKAA